MSLLNLLIMNLPLDNLLLALFLVLARMPLFQLLDGKLPLVNINKPCIIRTLLLDNGAWRLYKRGDNHRKHLYAFMSAVTLMLSTHSEILLDPTKPACASGRSHICLGTLTR